MGCLNMWHVYILKSLKDGRHYIGSTSDLCARIKRHNSGGNVSTRHRRPFELVKEETYNSKAEALRREREIKGLEHLIHSIEGVEGLGRFGCRRARQPGGRR